MEHHDAFEEYCEMAGLCSSKDYQGRGLGLALLRWGLDQATPESVPKRAEIQFFGSNAV